MHASLPSPPAWSLVLGSIGQYSLVIALALFLLSGVLSALEHFLKRSIRLNGFSFAVGCVFTFVSLASLIVLFLQDRLEFSYISQHTDTSYEWYYKLASVWSGQQGSFLLWAVASAFFGILSFRKTGSYRSVYIGLYSVFLAALCGILCYESPFALNLLHGKPIVPAEGLGLSPVLQNYWIVIHPPVIFLGFGGLTVGGAWALAALIKNDFSGWVEPVRPWVLVSFALLGLGLCMGGFWAYETLGWGGFWKWDPVENTSIVPWCLTAAFLHGLIIQSSKGSWRLANAFLGATSFLSFVYGTFLTRSGFLSETSVHSFADMDKAAYLVLLGFFILSLVGFLILLIYRWIKKGSEEQPGQREAKGLGREFYLTLGVTFLVGIAFAAGFGMSVPLVQSILHQKPKEVDEHLYHLGLVWLFIPLFLLLAIGPFISWTEKPLRQHFLRFVNPLSLSVGLLGISMVLVSNPSFGLSVDPHSQVEGPFGMRVGLYPWMMFLIWVCLFAFIGSVWKLFQSGYRRLAQWGVFLSHVGVVILLAGLIVSRGFERKVQLNIQEGTNAAGLGFVFTYEGLSTQEALYWASVYDRKNRLPFYAVGRAIQKAELKVGESFSYDGRQYTFSEPTSEGALGMIGSRISAIFVSPEKKLLAPSVEFSVSGMTHHPEKLSSNRFLVLDAVDPKARTIEVSIREGFVAQPRHYNLVNGEGTEVTMVTPHIQRYLSHDLYFTLHPQMIYASDETTFEVGETKQLGPLEVTYVGPKITDTKNMEKSEFRARLLVKTEAGEDTVEPMLRMTSEGIKPVYAQASPQYLVALESMDAKQKSVDLRLMFTRPLYQVDLLYKPMTILVWLGTGILTIGVAIAALARKSPRRRPSEPEIPANDLQ